MPNLQTVLRRLIGGRISWETAMPDCRGELLERALEAKRATRRALAALPFEEKLHRMFQLQANVRAFRAAKIVSPDENR